MSDEYPPPSSTSNRSPGAGGGMWQPPSIEEAAALFPQYEVLGLLGRGGMGAVYQARQLTLDRLVAIKLLPLEVSADRDFADRFVREARTMGKLSHPNIIAVYEFGQTHEGHFFFAMEFVEGTNLHQIIHGAGLAPAQALVIIGEVCDALAYAHGKGVVHRDIKPANVMVNAEGRVKVADFGLARLTDPGVEQFGHTQTGIVMGTPDYMAPEQKRGMNVDHRADIYSLGVMLYEMLCGETPQGMFDPPSHRVPVDARVDQVVSKALQQAPDRRFQSSTEMKAMVDTIRAMPAPKPRGGRVAGHAPGGEQPPAKSRSLLYAGLAAAAVALIGVLIFASRPKVKRGAAAATPVAPASIPAQTPAPSPPSTPARIAAITPEPAPASTPASPPLRGISLTPVVSAERHRYQFVPGNISWTEAKERAAALGGHLARIESPAELSLLIGIWCQPSLQGMQCIWLDGVAEREGEWKWSDGTTPAVSLESLGAVFDVGKSPEMGGFPASLSIARFRSDTSDRIHLDDVSDGETRPPFHWRQRVVGFLVEWDEPTVPAPAPVAVAPSPTPAKPAAAPEVVKWLGEQEAIFTAQWKAQAVAPFDAAVARLREQYNAAIEKNIADAAKAARLEDAIAWKNEMARIGAQQPHEAVDDANEPAALKQIRASWRLQFAKLDAERFAKATAVHQRFDSLLATGQTGYTQKQRLDDALLLKSKRDEIAKVWLAPPLDVSKAAPPKPAMGQTLAPPKPAGAGTGTMTGRDVVEHFVRMAGDTTFTAADGTSQHIPNSGKPEDVPKGKLELTGVAFHYLKRDGTDTTDADFAPVAPQRKLTRFVLQVGKVTGSGLGFLAGSPDLAEVAFTSPQLTGAVLEPLTGLRNLRTLSIRSSPAALDWSRLADLASLPALTSFSIDRGQDIPPATWARMRKVVRIQLEGSQLTEAHFAAIAALPDLDTFGLTGQAEAGAAGLKHFGKADRLAILSLVGCTGLEPHLGFIGRMRRLTTLSLDGPAAPGLTAAAGAPALRTINLAGAAGTQGITDAGLKAIADGFPRLESLTIMDAAERNVTADGLRALARMPKLKTFAWGKKPLPTDLAAALAALPALEQLVVGDSGIAEAQLAELAKSKSLIKLDIAHQKLTPAAVEVLKTMRGLRDLFVYNCGLTPTDIAALRKALPKCVVKDA